MLTENSAAPWIRGYIPEQPMFPQYYFPYYHNISSCGSGKTIWELFAPRSSSLSLPCHRSIKTIRLASVEATAIPGTWAVLGLKLLRLPFYVWHLMACVWSRSTKLFGFLLWNLSVILVISQKLQYWSPR